MTNTRKCHLLAPNRTGKGCQLGISDEKYIILAKMVQEMNILRCYSCNMFQVHIVKKANKWQCKICNEKQSIQHIYYQGSGQDCRLQVQHLNLMRHVKEQQASEELDNMEVFEKQDSSSSEIKKPVIGRSKWTKYMVPREESHEARSNEEEDIDPSYNCKKNTSNDVYTFQGNLTNSKNSIDEKFIDTIETEGYLPSTHYFSQNSNAISSKFDNKSTTGCFQSSNMLYKNSNCREDDVSLMEKRRPPCSISTSSFYEHTTIRCNTELIDDKKGPSQSNDYSCNSIERQQGLIIVSNHGKRKSDSENVIPKTESDLKSAGIMFKRSKLVDESSTRKQNLRDIVESNRFKAGKSLDKIMENSSSAVRNNNLVLKDINCSPNTRMNGTEISKPDSKRKTIFETDCDDLDEILDF